MAQEDHQLPLVLGGDSTPAQPRVRKKFNRKRSALPAPTLPLPERRFLPVVGVPATRKDCPDTSVAPCPHVRCKWHLWRIDAENRAGRPGLASVPRDEHGHTIAVTGDVGAQRAGTTLWPAWLELERTCKVVLVRDDNGVVTSFDTYTSATEIVGNWETFRQHTRDGEPLEVLSDGKLVGAAELTPEGIRFRYLLGGYVLTLRRMRGVPSCGADLIAQHGKMTNQQIGDALGLHRTLVARDVKSGARKVKAAGYDLRDLVDK